MPQLRFLTYNVRSLRDDKQKVAQVIRSCRPDLVAIQEAPRGVGWRSQRRWLARASGLQVLTPYRPAGLMVMATSAVTVKRTSLTKLPKNKNLHQRAVCRVELEFAGQPLTIASVHFSVKQDERLAHLPYVIEALRNPYGEIILAGDFNETPRDPVWQALATRWSDAFAKAPAGEARTSNAAKLRRQIDGVLVSAGITVVACRAVDAVAGVTRMAEASDHLPVEAILEVGFPD